jgi:elongation factor 3
MGKLCRVIGNLDIIPHLPLLIECMAHPDHVVNAMQTISATTFVQEVNGPVLAVMVPLLTRALKINSAATQRQTVIVIDNLCKLVRNTDDAMRFLPSLFPGVEHIKNDAAMPEVRGLAEHAHATMVNAGATKKVEVEDGGDVAKERLAEEFRTELGDVAGKARSSILDFVVGTAFELINNERKFTGWSELLAPYLQVLGQPGAGFVPAMMARYLERDNRLHGVAATEELGEGEVEIVNTMFSLAYGGMMLLNHSKMRLLKGHKYGLCGHNGAGKSTLMKAIANGKLEGFPSKDELRTCFVEHKLQAAESQDVPTILQYLAEDPELSEKQRARSEKALEAVGFDAERRAAKVSSLSGGWKMKLELARAMAMEADILLLDEPTNHLDVANIKWLMDYLNVSKDITALIVSHDSNFLDTVCTDIIHYEQKKLVYYKGNLSE